MQSAVQSAVQFVTLFLEDGAITSVVSFGLADGIGVGVTPRSFVKYAP